MVKQGEQELTIYIRNTFGTFSYYDSRHYKNIMQVKQNPLDVGY